MSRRFPYALIVCLSLVALLPSAALAHGPAPRGVVLRSPNSVTGLTGSCPCLDRWYTVGLRPGAVGLSARITRCAVRRGYSCAAQIELIRASDRSLVKLGQVRCGNGRHCTQVTHLTARTGRAGIFYVLVHGEGSLSIRYSLRFSGHTYALRCRKYC